MRSRSSDLKFGINLVTLLSVVVPTHNRSQYAASCIEAVLTLPSPSLELVVTDTSTDGLLKAFLDSEGAAFLKDPRFKYRFVQEPSNLTENHNAAMALATGRYVCVIGDDDCITQAALDAADWAVDNDVGVVSQIVATTYAWPDFRSRMARSGHAGRLYVPRRSGSARWRNSSEDLSAALANAFQGTHEMPRCYHGVVRRDLMEEIKDRTGAYFHGSSPDMSGAVALACITDRYFEVDAPLTIPGVSGGSNSGRSAMNTHKGDLSSETQTSGFQEEGWAAGVPRFFSVETVWAHAGLETLARLRPEKVVHFNFEKLIALCMTRHGEFADACEQAIAELQAMRDYDTRELVASEATRARWARRKQLAKRLLRPTVSNGRKYLSGLDSIAEASLAYERYAQAKAWQILPDIEAGGTVF